MKKPNALLKKLPGGKFTLTIDQIFRTIMNKRPQKPAILNGLIYTSTSTALISQLFIETLALAKKPYLLGTAEAIETNDSYLKSLLHKVNRVGPIKPVIFFEEDDTDIINKIADLRNASALTHSKFKEVSTKRGTIIARAYYTKERQRMPYLAEKTYTTGKINLGDLAIWPEGSLVALITRHPR